MGISGSSDLVDLGTFREDSLIDFVTGNVFCTFGGVTQERFSNFSSNRFFQAEKLPKNLLSKEEYYRQHNFKPNKLFKLGGGGA